MINLFEVAAKFAPLVTALIALIAALIAGFAIRAQRDIARRRAAIDFFLKTEMDHTLIDLYKKFKKVAPTIAKNQKVSDFAQTDDYHDVRAFLNICELIAVGINKGAFSEAVSLEYWGDVLPLAYKQTLPLIEYIRANDDHGSSFSYVDLQKVCERWDSESSKEKNKRRNYCLAATIFALLSGVVGLWSLLFPPLVLGAYLHALAAACALISAFFGFSVYLSFRSDARAL